MERIKVSIDSDLQDLIPNYLLNREKDVEKILHSLDAGEFDKIKRLGHRMKGSGGGYGFDKITDIGAILEQAAHQQDSHLVKEQLEILEDYLGRVEIVYD